MQVKTEDLNMWCPYKELDRLRYLHPLIACPLKHWLLEVIMLFLPVKKKHAVDLT